MDEKIIEMQKFKVLHQLNGHTLNNKSDDKNQLATLINNDLIKMSDVEKRRTLMKCLDDQQINNELLKFELKYLKITAKNMTMEEFIKETTAILKRYQSKAGGFLIEDDEWTLHNHKSKKYPLKKNEILFENTLVNIYKNDLETNIFLKRIINLLQNLASNFSVCLKFNKSHRDKIYWIIIKCKKLKN